MSRRRFVAGLVSLVIGLSLVQVVGPTPPATSGAEPVGTVVPAGDLSTPVTWGPQGSPYLLKGRLRVVAGGSVTILPGTVVKLLPTPEHSANLSQLLIYGGVLRANGTQSQPIVITSGYDDSVGGDSNGDGSATVPRPGDWYDISFSAPSEDVAKAAPTSSMSFVSVRFGGESSGTPCQAYGSVYISSFGKIRIARSEFTESQSAGVQIRSLRAGVGVAEVDSSYFRDSGCGMHIQGGTARNNVFADSLRTDAVWALAPKAAHMHNNWLFKRAYMYSAVDRTQADVHDNALLAGVADMPYDQEIQHLEHNWWGRPLPATPTGCYDHKTTYIPAVKYKYVSGSSCYKLIQGDITGYFTNVIPALDAPPPWPVAGITPVPGPTAAEPTYLAPEPLRLEQTFGTSCAAGPAVQNTQTAGDPVNTATGSLTETFRDVSVAGPGRTMNWTRTYNSLDALTGPLGRGWTFRYGDTLRQDADGLVTFRDGSGGQTRFQPRTAGGYEPVDPAVTATLRDRAEGGWLLRSQGCHELEFDGRGQLVIDRDREGREISLSYDQAGQLQTVTDAGGQTLTVEWGTTGAASNKITGVTTSDGRHIAYGYGVAAGEARLTSVRGVDGNTTHYGYDPATGGLSGITDALGRTSAISTYDPSTKRIVRQVDAAGAAMTFEYDEDTQTTTITDAEGRVRQDVYSGRNLVKQIDGSGAVTELRYAGNNLIAAVDDGNDQRETLWRDARGNVTKRVTPGLQVTTEEWTYDEANRVTSYRDGNGHLTSYAYTNEGQLSAITHPDGRNTAYTYTPKGELASETAPGGRVTSYQYNAVGDLIAVTAPSGAKTTMTYDSAHRMLTRTDPRGNVPGAARDDFTSSFTYDAAARILTETNPLGQQTSYTYDSVGNLTSVTDPAGKTIRYTYNARNQMATRTDPLDRVTTYEYDATGLLTTITEPGGGKTTYTYSASGQQASVTAPAGNAAGADVEARRRHTTRLTHDAAGNLIETRQVDPADPRSDLVTKYAYDANGRLTATTDPAGRTTNTEYNGSGQVTAVTTPDGARTTTDYDALGRPTRAVDADGRATTYAYNNHGDVGSVSAPGGRVTKFSHDVDGRIVGIVEPRGNVAGADPDQFRSTVEYDPAGNITTVRDPLGRATTTAWDPLNRRLSVTDPQGRVTAWQYTSTGALSTVTGPDGAETSYTYDDAGQLTAQTDPLQRVTSFSYHPTGHLASQTTPDGRITTYEYDDNGNRTTVVRPSGTSTPQTEDGTITTDYDWLNRPTSVRYSDNTPDRDFDYDPTGLPVRVTQHAASGPAVTAYSYDSSGRVNAIRRGDEEAAYSYTPSGQLLERRYADGRKFTYTYASDGQLASQTPWVNTTKGTATTYGWDAAGQLTSVGRPGAITSTYTYNEASELTGLKHAKSTSTLVDYSVTHNDSSEPVRVSMTRAGATTHTLYTYVDGHLTGVCRPTTGAECSHGSPQIRYTYDAAGRRASQTPDNLPGTHPLTYEYDAADRLVHVQSTDDADLENITWDRDGHLAERVIAGDTTTYEYGLDDNLVRIDLPDGREVTYTYDHDGNRLSRAVDGALDRTWAWDRLDPHLGIRIDERDGAAKRVHAWTPDPVTGLATAMSDTAGTVPLWLLTDPHGNLTDTATSSSGLTGTNSLNPFGDPAAAATGSAVNSPLRFHGQYLDEVTGLYDVRARDYDAGLAQFTAVDPATPARTHPFLTTYHYGYQNPLSFTDPTGMCSAWNWLKSMFEFGKPVQLNSCNSQDRAIAMSSTRSTVAADALAIGADNFANGVVTGFNDGLLGAALSGNPFCDDDYAEAGYRVGVGFSLGLDLMPSGHGDDVALGAAAVGMAGRNFGRRSLHSTINHGPGYQTYASAQKVTRGQNHAFEAHHIIQDARIKGHQEYRRADAPAIVLAEATHKATRAAQSRPQETYQDARQVAFAALLDAGFSPDQADFALRQADEYFIVRLGWTMDTKMDQLGAVP